MKTLYFITGNKGKVLEAKTKFSDLDIDSKDKLIKEICERILKLEQDMNE